MGHSERPRVGSVRKKLKLELGDGENGGRSQGMGNRTTADDSLRRSAMERREILKAMAFAIGASSLGFGSFAGALKAAGKNVFLGVQFFTFVGRNGAQMGWEKYSAAMESVRKIGYEGIELAGFSGYKPEDIRKRAGELDLAIPSVHCGFDQVFGFLPPPPLGPDDFTLAQDATYTPVAIVQIARAMSGPVRDVGAKYVVIAGSGKLNTSDLDHVNRFADAMNEANKLVREKDLMLSFHPHAPEFTPVQGKVPFNVLVERTAPSIKYELDVYWSALGGGDGDPVAVIDKYADRIGLFHLKDMDKDKKIATPGDGTFDFAAIKTAAEKCDSPYFFVERDNAPDPLAAAASSYQHLHKLGYGLRS
jgi:sugar phosphate isomerase/epimerase